MESRPPVSITGGPGDGGAPDVLDAEPEPRLTPAARRRLRLGGVFVVMAVAAAAAGVEVQERRAAAAEERRLAGVLQLSAPGWPRGISAPVSQPSSPGSVELLMRVLVRNDGPHEVTVTSASAGGFVYLLGPVPLPAQTSAELVLQQKLECSAESRPPSPDTPGPLLAPGPLQITAETRRGTRTTTIARPPYDTEQAAHLCALLRDGPPPQG